MDQYQKTFFKKNIMGSLNIFLRTLIKKILICWYTTKFIRIYNYYSSSHQTSFKKINKKNIKNQIILIENFYKEILNTTPKIGVLGLNPHCESILNYNEDENIIKPLVNEMRKKGLNISGPISADTAFLKNRKKYDVIVGMYHDQVLTPMKTLFEYDAINITLGLPFIKYLQTTDQMKKWWKICLIHSA